LVPDQQEQREPDRPDDGERADEAAADEKCQPAGIRPGARSATTNNARELLV
jgi:hypothetical protein